MAEVAQPLAHMLFPLDRMPVLHRTNTSGLFRTKLTSTFLVCWKKNTQAQREQAYSAQKGPQATIRFKEESIEMMRGACYQQTQIFRSWFCRDKNEIDIKWLSTNECNYYLVSIFYVHNTSIYTMIAKRVWANLRWLSCRQRARCAAKGQSRALEAAWSKRGMVMRRMSAVSVLLRSGYSVSENFIF